MQYSFNYGYLKKFKESNKLTKKDLLEALGTADGFTLGKWLDGKSPVHITALLRICNYYQICLSDFFIDEDGLAADFAPKAPLDETPTLPTDFGNEEVRKKGIVETKITERKITSAAQLAAVERGLARREEQLVRNGKIHEAATLDSNNIDELRIKLEHSELLRKIEADYNKRIADLTDRFDDERKRLLAIIEKLQAE